MKKQIKNIQEISPIILLSVLLFVSCTQLPIEDQNIDAGLAENIDENRMNDRNILVEDNESLITGTQPEPEAMEPSQLEQGEAVEEALEVINEDLSEMSAVPDTGIEDIASIEDTREETREVGQESLDQDEALMPNEEVRPSFEELVAINEEFIIHQRNIEALCEEIGDKLGSVSAEDCLIHDLEFAGGYSVNARPLAMRDFHSRSEDGAKTKVLIMGGIHGDEYSSISIMFKWMSLIQESGGNNYTWRFLPAVNPDGLLDGQAVRQNASGVDLNRNFPSLDWDTAAIEYWRNNTGENPRRYPGQAAASEPEVRWIIEQIEKFEPEVIVSVHAPYHLLDFDGPSQAPDKIGDLYLHELGVYPGSLGNYAGLGLGIPVVTLELPSAGIMPSSDQIETMWIDMLAWLNNRSRIGQQAGL
jgi:murein peptide amidase A